MIAVSDVYLNVNEVDEGNNFAQRVSVLYTLRTATASAKDKTSLFLINPS